MSFDDGKCGTEGRLSNVHSDIADLSSVNGGTAGNTDGRYSDGITHRHLPQAPLVCNRINDEMTQGTAVPLASVANNMIGSTAALKQMPYVAGQIVPRDNASQHGCMVQVCVFSTELANYAAESVVTGRYDSIIDFHRDYCAVPLLQV